MDDAIEGADKRIPGKEGRGIGIVCATCNGHLGQLLEGEGFPEQNVRHCVNSVALNFVPVSHSVKPQDGI
ncbi:MAG: peptide-methionine (R)-S-oxide reductase, partial [Bacteroidales bacterium]|nr:peptide-methionine (R)-S-oxide reductase [Bacteroidales bacterium]